MMSAQSAFKETSVRLDSGAASSGQGQFLKKCGKFHLQSTAPVSKKRYHERSYDCTLNKQYHVKVLLKRFHMNGHTIGFQPHTQKVEPHTK